MKSDISHYKIVPESDIITGHWFLSLKIVRCVYDIFKICLTCECGF